MTLKQYRAKLGITLEILAAQIDCSVSMLAFVEKGQRAPSRDMARRIIAATGGKVGHDDLPYRAPSRGAA